MANLFDESTLKVFEKFDPDEPRSILDIVEMFPDKLEITYLELYGDSLAKYVEDLAKYGYLLKQDDKFTLTPRGEEKLRKLRMVCAS